MGRRSGRQCNYGDAKITGKNFLQLVEGFLSVAKNGFYFRMLMKKIGNTIVFLISDIRIETAAAFAGINHIPECDMMSFQKRFSSGIICGKVFLEKLKHQFPETVLRMRIILLFFQRFSSGY